MAKKNKRKGIMYSTNPDYDYEYEDNEQETVSNDMQLLHVHIDKHRAGKTAVIIKGFIGTKNDLISLSKMLKRNCGVGGSVKNKEIIIQGNFREKIMTILNNEGYKTKRVGG